MNLPRAQTLAFALALVQTGCLSHETAPASPMCTASSDCGSGKVCGDDGVCYGDPPDIHFAAELYPPVGSPLARTEVSLLDISQDGTIGNAIFGRAVVVEGQVQVAEAPVAAKVEFRRPSRIPGGPDYVLTVDAVPGTEPQFRAYLLPNRRGEEYQVTIYPEADAAVGPTGTPTPAELGLPIRRSMSITEDARDVIFVLSDVDGLKQIHGRVVDAVGTPEEGLLVRGYGSYEGGSRELASSLGRTNEHGEFTVCVPKAWDDYFDVVVSGDGRPRITRREVYVRDPDGPWAVTAEIGDITLPAYPNPVSFTLPVVGRSAAGGTEAVEGALVTFTTQLVPTSAPGGSGDEAIFEASGVTDASGQVTLPLIPASGADGNRIYLVDVVPKPSTPEGGLWHEPVEVGPQPGTLAGLLLPRRVYVTGAFLGSSGEVVSGLTIHAHPTFTFLADLPEDKRPTATKLDWPTVDVGPDGKFGIYLDPSVLGMPTAYDLEVDPPSGSLTPRWSFDQIVAFDEVDPGEALDVGERRLPRASFARGEVLTHDGQGVEGAELRVYVLDEDPNACGGSYSQLPCQPPARLRALTKSDQDGALRLVLPDPLTPTQRPPSP